MKFYSSEVVDCLRVMGIVSVAKNQNQWVLDAVQGCRVPFIGQPQQHYPPTPIVLSKEGRSLMLEEIQGMLKKGEISEIHPKGWRGFVSPKKDSRQRPVINLKKFNKYVQTEHFNMEGIHVLNDLL